MSRLRLPYFLPVLRIRIRWIRKILASWIRIRKKNADPRIRIQGAKKTTKNCKKK